MQTHIFVHKLKISTHSKTAFVVIGDCISQRPGISKQASQSLAFLGSQPGYLGGGEDATEVAYSTKENASYTTV